MGTRNQTSGRGDGSWGEVENYAALAKSGGRRGKRLPCVHVSLKPAI